MRGPIIPPLSLNQKPLPTDKLIFPEFAPEMSMMDDRVDAISEWLRNLISTEWSTQYMEIEAKLGNFILSVQKEHLDPGAYRVF